MENWFEKNQTWGSLYIFCPSLDGVKGGKPGSNK
jgi:hypothetical protein